MTPGQPPAPPRRSFFDQFRGLRWWEFVLVILPFLLFAIAGLVGGVVGAIGLLSNLAIAHRPLSPGLKLVAMIGVVVACYVVTFVIAGFIYAVTHPS
jgi:hypothetical protein